MSSIAPQSAVTTPSAPGSGSRELIAAILLIAAGGGLALLAGSRPWDRIGVPRDPPLAAVVVHVAGHTIAPAVTGLAVVALAGVVALLATKGRARTAMGVVLALAGLALAWQSLTGLSVPSQSRAAELVADARTGVVLNSGQPPVVSTSSWPWLAFCGALLVIGGAALVVVRGARWSSLSARYDAPGPVPGEAGSAAVSVSADPETSQAKADLAMWQSLERGEDPTAS